MSHVLLRYWCQWLQPRVRLLGARASVIDRIEGLFLFSVVVAYVRFKDLGVGLHHQPGSLCNMIVQNSKKWVGK